MIARLWGASVAVLRFCCRCLLAIVTFCLSFSLAAWAVGSALSGRFYGFDDLTRVMVKAMESVGL